MTNREKSEPVKNENPAAPEPTQAPAPLAPADDKTAPGAEQEIFSASSAGGAETPDEKSAPPETAPAEKIGPAAQPVEETAIPPPQANSRKKAPPAPKRPKPHDHGPKKFTCKAAALRAIEAILQSIMLEEISPTQAKPLVGILKIMLPHLPESAGAGAGSGGTLSPETVGLLAQNPARLDLLQSLLSDDQLADILREPEEFGTEKDDAAEPGTEEGGV
jgi:hypothetical protein